MSNDIEKKYQALFEQSPYGILLIDTEGKLLDFNETAHRDLEYTREEFSNLTIADLDPIESTVDVKARISRILEKGSAEFETRHRTKQGETRDVHVITKAITLSGQTLLHSIWRDITERKRIENKLIYVMKAVESASDAIGISDSLGHHFYQNKAFTDLYGYATAEELELAGGGAATVKDPEVALEMYDDIMHGKSWVGELEVVTKSGRVFPAFERADAIKDNEGNIIGLIGIITDITERKKVEEALLNFQMAVDSAADAIGMSTPEGRHYYQNEAFTKLFGLSVSEVDGVSGPSATVYADEKVGLKIFDTIRNGGSFEGEVKMLDKDRDERDIYLRAYSIKSKEDKVVSLVGVHTDITNRKRAEDKLRKSESQLRESQEVAKLGNWDLDLVSQKLEWSDQTYRLFDKDPKEFVPSFNEFVRLVHPDDIETMQINFNNALKSDDTPYHVAVRIINDSGRDWVMEAFGAVRRDDNGNAIAIFGTAQDITERKQAEDKIRQSEVKYRNLFNSSTDGIFILDLDGNFIDINSTAHTRLGYTKEEMLSLHLSKLTPPSFSAKVSERQAHILDHGVSVFESAHLRKNGTVMPVEVNSRLLNYEGRQVYFSVIRDITERKIAEGQIMSALKEKEILLKEIHHRVKNNLQVVASMLHLQAGYIRDREARALFEESQKRIESMALLHEKLYQAKDLARIDFKEYVVDLVDNLLVLNTDKAKRIAMNLIIEDVMLDVNISIPCGLIINELVSNALAHAFPDERKGKVIITMRSMEKRIVLSVSDNGVGVPGDMDFRNTESLGMQLVNSLVNQINGSIELDRNEGTSFIIEFQAQL